MSQEQLLDNAQGSLNSSPLGVKFEEVIVSPRFPETKIVSFEKNGKVMRYALYRDSSGTLQGSEFEIMESAVVSGTGGQKIWRNSSSYLASGILNGEGVDNGQYKLSLVYQLHEDVLSKMEEYLAKESITI